MAVKIKKPAELLNDVKKMSLTPEQLQELLSSCYEKATHGIPGSQSCDAIAQEYLLKYEDPKIAAQKMIANQITKCTASGFITSLGGLITLPVAIPANVASVLYVQMRMIVSLAAMAGLDTSSDEAQTLAYLCLVNTSITDVVKSAGVQITNKVTLNMLKKLPGTVLTKINRAVGFRLITKFGEKGVINLWKIVPVAGGVVGGGFDYITTKKIANRAYKLFILEQVD